MATAGLGDVRVVDGVASEKAVVLLEPLDRLGAVVSLRLP